MLFGDFLYITERESREKPFVGFFSIAPWQFHIFASALLLLDPDLQQIKSNESSCRLQEDSLLLICAQQCGHLLCTLLDLIILVIFEIQPCLASCINRRLNFRHD